MRHPRPFLDKHDVGFVFHEYLGECSDFEAYFEVFFSLIRFFASRTRRGSIVVEKGKGKRAKGKERSERKK